MYFERKFQTMLVFPQREVLKKSSRKILSIMIDKQRLQFCICDKDS